MYRIAVSAVLVTALSMSGCGLIDPDITQFNLSLPDQEFTIDTAQWGLSGDATFPAIPCDPANDMCDDLTDLVCSSPECRGYCAPEQMTCRVEVSVALSESINLVEEKPELQTIDNQPFLQVTIDEVLYEVEENSLNFDSPEVRVYVAPQNVMSPDSPDARLVGIIETVPAMRSQAPTPMQLTSDGEGNLRDMMGDYRSVFNVIVGTTVDIGEGMEMPSGRAVARVAVDAHAGL